MCWNLCVHLLLPGSAGRAWTKGRPWTIWSKRSNGWISKYIYIYILNTLAKVSSHFWGPVIRHCYYFREILDETENQEDLENMARRDLRWNDRKRRICTMCVIPRRKFHTSLNICLLAGWTRPSWKQWRQRRAWWWRKQSSLWRCWKHLLSDLKRIVQYCAVCFRAQQVRMDLVGRR